MNHPDIHDAAAPVAPDESAGVYRWAGVGRSRPETKREVHAPGAQEPECIEIHEDPEHHPRAPSAADFFTSSENIVRALGIRYGSVEIVVHDGRVVQIERKEKLRCDHVHRGPGR